MLKLYRLVIVVVIISLSTGCYFSPEKKEVKQIIKQEESKNKNVISSIKKKKVDITEKNKIEEVFLEKPKKIISKFEVKKENNKIIKKVVNDITKNKYLRKSTILNKKNLDAFAFDLIKKGKSDDNTLLIVGGIQGDEPGGFMAASIISTHYTITKGSVWIVPNLNLYSIIKRSRGPFGDMNRKFANLPKDDPEYKIVQRIKKYIIDPKVKLILNLHDGSGFYRPMYIDKMHQPRKWGQTIVIDQEILPNVKKYADTYTISEEVNNHLNKYLLKEEDIYRTKNTHTRFKKTYVEQEMAKTLTYYAVTNGKSAFGHETSKSLNIPERVYYKLLALEKFMDIMGIKYKREFPMTIDGIKSVLNDDISITFDDIHIKMPLKDIRNIQKHFPIKSNGVVNYLPSNPLIKIIKQNNVYTIYYGNRRLTRLEADYAEHLNINTEISFKIDGKIKKVKFGDTINVKKEFLVMDGKVFRVNVIGYKHKSGIETNKNIDKNMFMKRYSVDKDGNIYRVEFYKKKKFAGMILVNYTK
ncbi:MAG: deacylase [Arcobacteraceae bacterium]|nr:deacylase [Arcobacteraceae bacterium]